MNRRLSIFALFAAVIAILPLSPAAHAGWKAVSLPDPDADWELYKVEFVSSDDGWAVGWDRSNDRGGILHYDGAWKTVAVPDAGSSSWHINDVHFVSSTEGWAVGFDKMNRKGLVLHYSGTWTIVDTLYTSPNWNLKGLHFTSREEGWAVGYDVSTQKGILLHYFKGSWMTDSLPSISSYQWELYGVHFTSSREGWAVGRDFANSNGVLLHYWNGSWYKVDPPGVAASWYLESVHFTSSGEGWAAGWDSDGKGAMLRCTSGRWEAVIPSSLDLEFGLLSVHFVSEDEGWAAGYDSTNHGVLLHYKNGAWAIEDLKDVAGSSSFSGLDFTSSKNGWAVGVDELNGKGVLLKCSPDPVPDISVSPLSVNFGQVVVNIASEKVITVRNKGTDDLVLGPIGSLLSPFTLTAQTCIEDETLMPDDSCSMTMSFLPVATGSFSSDFVFSSNDPDELDITIKLTGTGVLGPDLTAQWDPIVQTCKETKKGTKCKFKGALLIQNSGDQDAKSSTLKFYLSEDAVYDAADTFLKQVSTGKIKAGRIKAKRLSYSLPVGETGSGRFLIADIDPEKAIYESDDTNNVAAGPVE